METTPITRQELLIEHDIEVGRFLFYSNIVIGEFYEGVHVTKENSEKAIQLALQIYDDNIPVIYISHRLHSYSMDPVGYKKVVDMFPNFVGFAIVSENRYRRMIASIERLFIKKPIGVFYTMESAFVWAEELLQKKS